MSAVPTDLTQLLVRWKNGDPSAESALLEAAYPVLKMIAAKHMSERDRIAFAVTELVNEAYLRLIEQRQRPFANRGHFFAIAARVMRRVLIDQVRERAAEKRGAGWVQVSMGQAQYQGANEGLDGDQLLALDQALAQLESVRPRAAKLVELRYFGGLTFDEAATDCEISLATAKRDWQFAVAFLQDRLGRIV